MAKGLAREKAREMPLNKEAYFESYERWSEEVHEGAAPETGLLAKGREQRKEICEDVKLSNREKGLAFVADGISTASGWLASRETARVLWDRLGEELDQEIENVVEAAMRNGGDVEKAVTQYIDGQIKAAITEADQAISAMDSRAGFRGAGATTLSLTKLVEIPNREGGFTQRLFFSNVGDSRIYVQRKNRSLEQITQDDSWLQSLVERGELTQAEVDEIDQAPDPRAIQDARLRKYATARRRSKVEKQIGLGGATDGLSVSYIDVQEGDRIVLVSDGVSDQLLNKDLERLLNEGETDAAAEQQIQGAALKMSLEGKDPRSKGDDVSAIVLTIGERGPSREYLKGDAPEGVGLEELKERVQESAKAELAWRQEKIRLQRNIVELGLSSTRDQLLGEMIALEAAKKNETWYEAHKEQQQLSVFEALMPRRFEAGDKVSMWRDDLDPPGFDLRSWDVMGYEPSTRTYTVKSGSGKPLQISRYQLEMKQPVIPRAGDTMAIKNRKGDWEPGWTLLDKGSDGKYVYAKEIAPEIFKYERVSLADANAAAQQELFLAEKGRKRMLAAVDRFKDLKIQERRLIDEQQEKEAKKALAAATRRAK